VSRAHSSRLYIFGKFFRSSVCDGGGGGEVDDEREK